MNTIPASQLVNVQPSVIGTGGSALSLNAVFITESTLIPIDKLVLFSTLADAKALFGAGSVEAEQAAIYFNGFKGANIKPSTLYFVRYISSDDGSEAWVRGAALTLTLTQLKALSGTLSVVIDGSTVSGGTINLSAATSFANAATIIQTALEDAMVIYNADLKAFQINSTTTGADSTIEFATGALASGLRLTDDTGAVISQGAAASLPTELMDSIISQNQNWATFMTLFEPDYDTKLQFAGWVNDQNLRYAYVMWDSDTNATETDSSSIGAYLLQEEFDGVIPVYPNIEVASFICGTAASIDFTELNGRITFAFKGQSGLVPTVTNATTANNLIANGYNFYGAYATATDTFNLLQNGQITGEWRWIDAYINQIYLNSQLQLAILTMLSNVKSLPYNNDGYGMIRAACMGPINEAINFGAIRAGIPLSEGQIAEINNAAGLKIDGILYERGWYLQILPATAQVRGNRTSPPMKLWYTDGGSIQKINLASIDVM